MLADSEERREKQETTKEVESQERALLERSAGYRVRKIGVFREINFGVKMYPHSQRDFGI